MTTSGCIGHLYFCFFPSSCSCFVIMLVARAIGVNRRYLWLTRIASVAAQRKSKMCRFISEVCSGSRVGCDGLRECRRHACRYSETRNPGLRFVRRETAGRERKGSAARLVQRMNARREALRSGATPAARSIEARLARTREAEYRHPKFSVIARPGFDCATTTARRILQHCTCAAAVFPLSVWNETGRRLCAESVSVAIAAKGAMIGDRDPGADCNRNGQASGRLLSHRFQSSRRRACSNTFFRIADRRSTCRG